MENCGFGWAGPRKWPAITPVPGKAGEKRAANWNSFLRTTGQYMLSESRPDLHGSWDKPAALDFSERAMAANPVEKDAVAGPFPIEVFARVAAGKGDRPRHGALEHLLVFPTAARWLGRPLTPALLRLDPMLIPSE